MSAHRFSFPKVTEIRVTRGSSASAAISQRDLVAASLLMRPYGTQPGERREGRAA
jgi:hypothetical protein